MYIDLYNLSSNIQGPVLGLALGNRSASLYHLGHYEAASQDIDMALTNHYPRHLQYKLYLRQAHCSIRLGQYDRYVITNDI